MKVFYRHYNKKDRFALENIIREAWNYDRLASPETARQLARVFLTSCLANSTYTRVAIVNGEVKGIIALKNKKQYKRSWKKSFDQMIAILQLLMNKEGRKVMRLFGSVSDLDQMLLQEVDVEYEGELSLFVLDKECRGAGIGKKLYQEGMRYLNENEIDSFHLFTDTSCNYGFYESRGLLRRIEHTKEVFVNGEKAPMTFFIYDNLKEKAVSL